MRDVYGAIADPTRREIIALLAQSDDLPLHAITAEFPMGRTAVAKHLRILRDAELVTEHRIGRESRYRFNPAPLNEVQQWISHYEMFWTARLDQLKALLEETTHE